MVIATADLPDSVRSVWVEDEQVLVLASRLDGGQRAAEIAMRRGQTGHAAGTDVPDRSGTAMHNGTVLTSANGSVADGR